jgi:hypothetical protein
MNNLKSDQLPTVREIQLTEISQLNVIKPVIDIVLIKLNG